MRDPNIPPIVDEALTVDIVNGEIVLDGYPNVMVSLTPAAAIATGNALIAAGRDLQRKA